MKYQPVVMFFTMTLHPGPSLMKDPLNVNELFSFVLSSRVSVAVRYRLRYSLSFLITVLPCASFKLDHFILPHLYNLAYKSGFDQLLARTTFPWYQALCKNLI